MEILAELLVLLFEVVLEIVMPVLQGFMNMLAWLFRLAVEALIYLPTGGDGKPADRSKKSATDADRAPPTSADP